MTNRWDETWHRLREWTNGQTPSERLAAQILIHEGYRNLDPIHPLGGKDGGKDALCEKDGQKWIMAVYFPRGQKSFKEIQDKFLDDLKGVKASPADALAFITNQELRDSERQKLHDCAGNISVELFHLERITAILDQPKMYGVRSQFLQINSTESDKAISIRCLLSLEIQQDCQLLQELLDHNQQSYLTERWESCFRENRNVWQDISSRLILVQSVDNETTKSIQNFYGKLNKIEDTCRDLLLLKSRAQALMEKSADHRYGYVAEQDQVALISSKKSNSMTLKDLREEIQEALDLGDQITDELSSS